MNLDSAQCHPDPLRRLRSLRPLRWLTALRPLNRPLIAELMEAAVVVCALPAGVLLRFEFEPPAAYLAMVAGALPLVVAVKLALFRWFGLRQVAWRHFGLDDLVRIAAAHGVASLAVAAGLRLWIDPGFPRSIFVMDFLLCLLGETGIRACVRILAERNQRGRSGGSRRRTLIYGAGNAGLIVLSEIRAHPTLDCEVAGFLDDDPGKLGKRIHGLTVQGGCQELPAVARRLGVEEVLIALPSVSGPRLTAILERCHEAQVSAKRVPALSELIANTVLLEQIREVRIEDLLDRPPAVLDTTEVAGRLTGRVVMVTGAGGSIGSELCRQIARHRPSLLIGFDQAETALYEIEQELAGGHPALKFHPAVGDIQSRTRLAEVFAQFRPHAVYHAAAYKHVPMMEAHLFEAIANNIFGTRNVVESALASGAEDFVLISSDKAVRPTNIMGATKRVAELVALAAAAGTGRSTSTGSGGRSGAGRGTKMAAVRFGNVLGSSGSVIPKFLRQITEGGPLTVTHPEMRRFFMTIPEAAQLVLQAGAMGRGAEIFVLEMGDPVRIVDLARKLTRLSGLRPDVDIPIVFSGTRPGEKMYEELSAYEENTVPTLRSQIRAFTGSVPEPAELNRSLALLAESLRVRDAGAAVNCIRELVPDYKPSETILRRTAAAKALSVA